MNVTYNSDEMSRIGEARESFSGLLLTDRQFDDVIAITGIHERSIKETGKFKEKLDHFSSALAATEKFDIAKANTIIRDLFKARTGVTMNQMREALVEREKALFDKENPVPEAEKQKAYMAANEVGRMVEEGTKMTFNRAFAFEASQLATELNITDVGAKIFISDTFEEIEGRAFREWGKELDETFYRPQVEAEKQQRKEEKSYSRSRQPSFS